MHILFGSSLCFCLHRLLYCLYDFYAHLFSADRTVLLAMLSSVRPSVYLFVTMCIVALSGLVKGIESG